MMTENPWSNPGNNRPGSNLPPTDGERPSQPKDKPANSAQSWDRWQQQRANRGGNGGGSFPPSSWQDLQKYFHGDGPLALGIIGVLVALWIGSGIYRVQPEENVIITRFGKYTDTVEAQGLNYRLPWPIEAAEKVNVTRERPLEIGFVSTGASKVDNPDESQILTGDANIVDLDFVVQWRVGNAHDFVFNIRDPENTIKKVAESTMREVVGQYDLQDIITDEREDVAANVRKTMQEILNSYHSGVSITQVLIQDASVPGPVIDAFEDVIRATQEAETKKNQAYKYRNEIVPRAQGQAIRLVTEAEGYKQEVVSQANGEAKRFNSIYSAYKQAPSVTRERLYIQAVQDVLQKSDKMLIDSQSGALPYLNLNELRRTAEKSTDANNEGQ